MNKKTKVVVIGGTGLIGKKVVMNLGQRGHEVVATSPSSGVNTVTGDGLAQALAGAQVVVDVSNARNWEDNAVLAFFETSGRNLLAEEAAVVTDRRVEKGVGSLFLTEVAKSKFESIDSMLEQLGKRRSENQEGHYGTN